ncbi:MAG: hypothetical protein C4278_00990 [Patescibacteria group bacterium]
MRLEEKIYDLIKETVEDLGYKIVKIEIGGKKKKEVVIYIDNEIQRIGINDCVRVSRAIDPILENSDLIKESWTLIVSSPKRK